jgi:hypothetical protein
MLARSGSGLVLPIGYRQLSVNYFCLFTFALINMLS